MSVCWACVDLFIFHITASERQFLLVMLFKLLWRSQFAIQILLALICIVELKFFYLQKIKGLIIFKTPNPSPKGNVIWQPYCPRNRKESWLQLQVLGNMQPSNFLNHSIVLQVCCDHPFSALWRSLDVLWAFQRNTALQQRWILQVHL